MDILSRDNIYQKIEWIKEKGLWLIIVLLVTATVFFAALWFTIFVLFLIQPEPYFATTHPEFQAKRQNNVKLFSVYENIALKTEFCNHQGFAYAGSSMGQDQFCSFNYQKMPKLNGPYDISLQGLSSLQVRYASVCILQLLKHKHKPIREIFNESQTDLHRKQPQHRYVCQKYRAYQNIHIANELNQHELIFFQIQLQLTQKGYDSFQGSNLKLIFEQNAGYTERFIIDYYWIITLIISLIVASWAAFLAFTIGVAIIVRKILQQKQKQEQQLLQDIRKGRKRD